MSVQYIDHGAVSEKLYSMAESGTDWKFAHFAELYSVWVWKYNSIRKWEVILFFDELGFHFWPTLSSQSKYLQKRHITVFIELISGSRDETFRPYLSSWTSLNWVMCLLDKNSGTICAIEPLAGHISTNENQLGALRTNWSAAARVGKILLFRENLRSRICREIHIKIKMPNLKRPGNGRRCRFFRAKERYRLYQHTGNPFYGVNGLYPFFWMDFSRIYKINSYYTSNWGIVFQKYYLWYLCYGVCSAFYSFLTDIYIRRWLL